MTAHQQKRLILAVSIILLALIVLLIGWRHQRTVIAFLAQWQDYRQYVLDIRHLGPYAFLVFGLVMVVMTVIPGAPTSAVAMLVGVCLGHWGVLIGYAVPMIPTAFVNLAAGDTQLTAKAQSWACLAGSTIVAFIYAFAGDLLILKQDWKSLLILLTIAVVIGLAEYGIRMRRDAVVRGTD
ncbi:VTT domain-containing protein [Latilactobacillus sakei]|uniref:VTT domain-containing protein n=1 Tax=Latilactobacillus sakei TaxID=1599 RepID=UPI0020C77088|nr:VTT domain-containing protein [Latilactobacillus sakei]MCP8856532.1 VTT domain-containing protein [Latilactobacillus sakei]